jgi:hypothetical protein
MITETHVSTATRGPVVEPKSMTGCRLRDTGVTNWHRLARPPGTGGLPAGPPGDRWTTCQTARGRVDYLPDRPGTGGLPARPPGTGGLPAGLPGDGWTTCQTARGRVDYLPDRPGAGGLPAGPPGDGWTTCQAARATWTRTNLRGGSLLGTLSAVPTNSSSDLPPWASKLLLGIFVLAVIPIAVYGVYNQIVTARDVVPAIQDTLLTPYANAIAAGEYDSAHATFVSDAYRERVGLDAYRSGQQENLERFGAPKSLEIDVCNETKEPGRPWFTTCNVRYEGAKQEAFLSLEIVEEEGRYLIDRSYARDVGLKGRREQVF